MPSPQRGARRLRGAASGRSRGRGGPRGEGAASPAPLQCPQSPSHYLGRERGGDEEGARVGTERAQRSLGHPREPATGRVPGDLACGRPFQPGDGGWEGALIGAKTSVRKQVALGSREPPARTQRKSRRPSPPEETPPQPSAATAGRAGLRGCGAGTALRLLEGWSGEGRNGTRWRRPGPLPVSRVGGGGRTGAQQSPGGSGEAETLSVDLAAHRLQRLRRHGVSSNHQPRQQGHHTHDDVKRCYGNR